MFFSNLHVGCLFIKLLVPNALEKKNKSCPSLFEVLDPFYSLFILTCSERLCYCESIFIFISFLCLTSFLLSFL